MRKTYLTIIFLLFTGLIWAQQSILLNNGKRIYVNDVYIDSTGIVWYKTLKNKEKWEHISDVFSWTRKDSVEVIFYHPECEDVCFKINQMRDYLKGVADAREDYNHIFKTPGTTIISFLVGAGTGFASSITGFAFLSPIPPTINSIIIGYIPVKEEKLKISKEHKDNQHYLEGYKNTIKKKRIINSIISGVSGLAVGIGCSFLFTVE